MINLTQIQSLEKKVIKAVDLIRRLREENIALHSRLESTEAKIHDLETSVHTYKKDQSAIERGILNVLSKLDKLEDEVSVSDQPPERDKSHTVLRDEEETPTAVSKQQTPRAARSEKSRAETKANEPSASADKKTELDIF